MSWNKETTARLLEVIGQSVKARRVVKEITQEGEHFLRKSSIDFKGTRDSR
jgi:hypothetical protein